MPRFARTTLAVALTASLAGCGSVFNAGGDSLSNDNYTYESTTWSPKSVELIDTRTAETLWSVDIPVGQKVTMKFEREHGDRDNSFPDRMTWVVQGLNSDSWRGRQSMLVPGPGSRLVEVSLRPAPEMEAQTAASPEPPALEPAPAPDDAPDTDANGLGDNG